MNHHLSQSTAGSPPLTPMPISMSSDAPGVHHRHLDLERDSTTRPPTPAPSPPPSHSHSEDDYVEYLRRQVNALGSRERQLLLTHLVLDSSPAALSPLLPLITPRLKRDFLKTLPVELAFHVLSFVDDVKALARAAAVSRFWRALLEDEATWKRMCWRSGFGNAPQPPQQPPKPDASSLEAYQFGRMRTLEFGTPSHSDHDDSDLFTPAGRERRGTLDRVALSEFAARAELFDLPVAARRNSHSTTTTAAAAAVAAAAAARESDRAREREGSWSDAPLPAQPQPSRRATVDETASSSSSHTGLGFATSVISTARTGGGGGGIAERRGTRPVQAVSTSNEEDTTHSRPRRRASALEPPTTAHDNGPLSRSSASSQQQQQRQSSLPASTSTLVSPPMFSLPNASPSPAARALRARAAQGDDFEPASTSMYAPLPTSSTTFFSTPRVADGGGGRDDQSPTADPTPRRSDSTGRAPGGPPAPVLDAPPGRRQGGGGPVVNPFSYKTHFKRAYLTESKWLRGPGRLLSTQMSADDGVVTSLGFDSEWIVVGMATSKVHVFDANEGRYVRTLEGHELGVWCLTLVSKGGGQRPSSPSASPSASGSASLGKSRTAPQRRRRRRQRGRDEPRRDRDDDRDDEEEDDDDQNGYEDGEEVEDGEMTSLHARGGEFFPAHGRSSTTQDDSPRPLSSSAAAAAAEARAHSRGGGIPRRRRSFPSVSVPSSPLPYSPYYEPSSSSSDSRSKTGGMGLGAGGRTGDSAQQAGVCSTARGWGRKGAVVVSGGCDRDVRVWDVESGECLHTLRGHTSTVRCMRVLDGRPVAVSGSRDSTLRVWDLEKGECVHLLSGHEHSVRCIEVSGNKVVSGSYDATCRLWDVDTGQCLHVFRGHIHQIYAVAFDGIRVVTGSLDSTVRIWSAETGEFLALLQGHTSLVGQLILLPGSDSGSSAAATASAGAGAGAGVAMGQTHHHHRTPATLVTGGSDGRVIVFDLETFDTVHRLCAHDNSVTCLQVDERFIVTGGNDGRIKLWDLRTGLFVRELIDPCGAVWRVVFRDDKCVTLCRRDGKTLMDVRTFRPSEEELFGDGGGQS